MAALLCILLLMVVHLMNLYVTVMTEIFIVHLSFEPYASGPAGHQFRKLYLAENRLDNIHK